MNILYYIPNIGQQFGGTRQYSNLLLSILSEDQTDNHYYILHNAEDDQVLEIVTYATNMTLIPPLLGKENNYQKLLRYFTKFINSILNKLNLSYRIKYYSYLNRLCKKYQIDIIHFPANFNHFVSGTKVIGTLHDVQHLHFPEYFTQRQMSKRSAVISHILSITDLIIVSYSHVKMDLRRYFEVPDHKIIVCLLAMRNLWFKDFELKPVVDISYLNLPVSFLLYPANTWKHKNHTGLLEAVWYLRNNKNITVNIICTGHQNSNFDETILPKLEELNLKNQVRFLGVVSEAVLYSLYRRCIGVVIPTTYEAGSFPLMESMIMGIPVICSNVTSLPETIGDPRFVFDPFNITDMADKILEIYSSEQYRNLNKINSKLNAEKILNSEALNKIHCAYKYLCDDDYINRMVNIP